MIERNLIYFSVCLASIQIYRVFMYSDLQWRCFSVKMRALEEIVIPEYSGSMLRGAFGHALKRVLCTVHHGRCNECHRREQCQYFQIFESDNPALKSQGLRYMPHPFVIVPPLGPIQLSEDNEIEWKIKIFGPALEQARYLMVALRSMAAMGLGAKRIQFELIGIESDGISIYDPETDSFEIPEPLSVQEYVENRVKQITDQVNIDFETPMRLSRQGKDIYSLSSDLLIDAIIRRFKLMFSLYGSYDEQDIENVSCSLKKVNEVKIIANRYSNRQGKKTSLRGIRGEYILSNCSQQLRKLLVAMELLHIGKNTGFGFGRPTIRINKSKEVA